MAISILLVGYFESDPRKTCSAALLLTLGAQRYEASEWMLSVIFDFSYMIYVFGCVAQ